VGSVEAKQLSAAVGAVLHDAALPAVQSILLQESRIIPDPDGLTSHGILTFQILTDAN
jgi:LDH2 family malate/lactate/ureidoglycolate dehydrogenase